MRSPLAETQRKALIEAMLYDVAFDGWSRAALRAAARRIEVPPEEAAALFPGATADFVAEFSHWADRQMLDHLELAPLESLRVAERIALAIGIRLDVLAPWREATRRALTILALPQNLPLALRLIYDTVDGIWYAAGDGATDFSFYTKRMSLAAIWAATMLYWLEDRSEGSADTRAFVERRLEGAARLGRTRRRVADAAGHLPNPLRLLRPLR